MKMIKQMLRPDIAVPIKRKRKRRNREYLEDIGEILKEIRVCEKKTQKEMAKILNVSVQQWNKYEKGTNSISANDICMICKALQIEYSTILPYVLDF